MSKVKKLTPTYRSEIAQEILTDENTHVMLFVRSVHDENWEVYAAGGFTVLEAVGALEVLKLYVAENGLKTTEEE